MKTFIIENFSLLYFLTCMISAVITTGWYYAFISRECYIPKYYRKDLGISIFLGMFSSILGPLAILMAFLFTGFAEHGWSIKPNKQNE